MKNPGLFTKLNSSASLCGLDSTNLSEVYLTTGKSIKECIKTTQAAVVYIWDPRCTSKVCYPLSLLQQKCDEKGLTLFVIAEYYDEEMMSLPHQIAKPIFGIDTEYYKTNLTSKYLSLFVLDLTTERYNGGRFLFFKKGEFIQALSSFEELGLKM